MITYNFRRAYVWTVITMFIFGAIGCVMTKNYDFALIAGGSALGFLSWTKREL